MGVSQLFTALHVTNNCAAVPQPLFLKSGGPAICDILHQLLYASIYLSCNNHTSRKHLITIMSAGMRILCQCGAIDFTTSHHVPQEVYFCHCLECRKQSSSAFGISAIFPTEGTWPPSADIMAHLKMWSRPSKSGGVLQCYFCDKCGVRIAHITKLPDGSFRDSISIKGGAVQGLNVTGAKHIWTRSAIVAVPDGSARESPPP